MTEPRWSYWVRFAGLAAGSLGLLFVFVFAFLQQTFLLDLRLSQSGYSFPVVNPSLPAPPPPPAPREVRRPVERGPAERFWAEYVPLARSGHDSAAAELLSSYLKGHGEDLAARVENARTLWRLGRLEAADAEYRHAVAVGAGQDVKRELAQLRVVTRRWDDALAIYEDLAHAAPQDSSLLREFAEVATMAERYDQALELYAQLVELAPHDPELRLQWARVLYWANRPELADEMLAGLPQGISGVDSLREAIAVALPGQPTDSEAATAVGILDRARGLALRGAVDSALLLYRRHLSEAPAADSVLLEMADVYEFRAKAPDSAMALLRAYLSRHPDAQEVRLRLAHLLAWSGRVDAAEATADSVARAWPENAAAWALLGDLYRWRGDHDRAAIAYRRALALDATEAQATAGLLALRAQVEEALAGAGSTAPAGRVYYFSDSEDFRVARWRGAWSVGSPRSRAGLEVAVERLRGLDLTGQPATLSAAAVGVGVERWWLEGELQGTASIGAWIPEGSAGVEPTLTVSLAAPDWRGAGYRLEYRHGPAYRESSTLETTVVDLRVDAIEMEHYRPLTERWELVASSRVTRFSGGGNANVRADGGVGLTFRPGGRWALGYETRVLTFAEPAPRPARRLYWDPELFWAHSAMVSWSGEPATGWQLDVQVTPGVAWLRERGTEPTVSALLGVTVGVQRDWGEWTLGGRAAFNQSRAGSYRAFGLELELTRRFGP